jgi:transcriptional regulator with XRE-family HTH domain
MEYTLGDRIRLARTRLRMSQAELARRIGISTTAMNQIEMGNTDPRASRIPAIARALHTTTDYLLGMRQEEKEDECEPAAVALVGA